MKYAFNSKQNVYPIRGTANQPTVMVVDDDRSLRLLISTMLEKMGYHILEATDGQDAWEQMHAADAPILDAILLDREMPRMHGMVLLEKLKNDTHLNKVPVVMITGAGDPSTMRESMEAGVFYYLTKPINETVLSSVVTAAAREAQQRQSLQSELGRHANSFKLMDYAKYTFQTLEEAENLAAFLASCFPEPDRVVMGLAELLTNAVEHGNCEIGYEEKGRLLASGNWREEVNRRTKLPQYTSRRARATFWHDDTGYAITISDAGQGFQWESYLTIDPARAGDNHGRGIAQAHAVSFDRLQFNEKGNEVTAVVLRQTPLNW